MKNEIKAREKIRVAGVGAGGHARVMIEIIRSMGLVELIGMLDVNSALHGTEIAGVSVLGDDSMLPELLKQGVSAVFIGFGGIKDLSPRRVVYNRIKSLGFRFVDVIHPAACVSESVSMGQGITVMAAVVVNAGTKVGDNVIFNSGSIIEHDCVIGNHSHIAPGAVLAGNVEVGEQTFIGAGAVVRQGVKIGARVIVGAGAVVVKDVGSGVTVAGCPARPFST